MAKNRGINVQYGKGEDKIFPKSSFGTIFLIVTLCFLSSPKKTFTEIHRILHPDGKVVIGLVTLESAWGQLYEKQKRKGHPFYSYANFFTYDEILEILRETGFIIDKTTLTLFQKPNNVVNIEYPREGYHSDAGFTIIVAKKQNLTKS